MNFEHNTYPFRQDSSFLYYIGIKNPKLAAVVDIQAGETVLFGDEMTIDDIVWMGQQQTLNEKAEWVGIASVRPFHELKNYLENAQSTIIQYTIYLLIKRTTSYYCNTY
ncbi:aminopeptidase P N-terminal domain-containing protein [Sphingobacterium sp. KU25419]|nr:aminopeptidase P N-terminal domain-containing protein [Sphingobacterium sp. KU25419]